MSAGLPGNAVKKASGWLVLCAVVLLMHLLIRPLGNFPLNDDWSYGRAVHTWMETGRLQFTGWTSVPLIAQAFWGMLFCLPFGFSFNALRLSTTFAGVLGIGGVFSFMRSAGSDRPTALAAALTVAVNPLYVNLSHTFMTDVPFTAACVWALAGFARSFSDMRRRWFWLGMGCSLIAILIRHTGLVVPLAYLLACRFGPRDATRSRAWWPAVIATPVLVAFCAYGAARLGLRPFWATQSGQLVAGMGANGLGFRVLERAGEIVVYLGAFSLPYALFMLAGETRRRAVIVLAGMASFAAIAVFGLIRFGARFPFAGNILYDTGLGPVRLYDVTTCGLPHLVTAPFGMWTLVAGLGVAAAFYAGLLLVTTWRCSEVVSCRVRRTRWLVGLCAAGWVAPMLIAGYFDRYLLVLLPLWLFGMNPAMHHQMQRSRMMLGAALVVFLIWGGFSVVATHDYFAWNRARWVGLNELLENRRIDPDRIDGGFEFNAWHSYDPNHPADREPPPERSWWWVADDEYVITLGPVPGYTESMRIPFPRWLGKSPSAIYVLRREEAAP